MNSNLRDARLAIMVGNPVIGFIGARMPENSNYADVIFEVVFDHSTLWRIVQINKSIDAALTFMFLRILALNQATIESLPDYQGVEWIGHVSGVGGLN